MTSGSSEDVDLAEAPQKVRRLILDQRRRREEAKRRYVQAKQEAEQAELEAEQAERRAGRSLLKYGFPPLRKGLVASISQWTPRIDAATWEEHAFTWDQEQSRTAGSSSLWFSTEADMLGWWTEADIQDIVVRVLLDLRQEFGLEGVGIRYKRGIVSILTDLIVLQSMNEEMLGFVVVQLTIKGTMNDAYVCGKVFDHLWLLRSSGFQSCLLAS